MEEMNKKTPVESVAAEDINIDANGHPRKRQVLADDSVVFLSDEEVADANRAIRENMN